MPDEAKGQGEEKGQGPYAGRPPRSRVYVDELERLKDLFSEHPRIKWAIYLAGFGGLMEGGRVLWDILKFLANLTSRH